MTTPSTQPQRTPGVRSLLSQDSDIMLKTPERGGNLTRGEPRALSHKDTATWREHSVPSTRPLSPSTGRAKLLEAPLSINSSAKPQPSLNHTGLSKDHSENTPAGHVWRLLVQPPFLAVQLIFTLDRKSAHFFYKWLMGNIFYFMSHTVSVFANTLRL